MYVYFYSDVKKIKEKLNINGKEKEFSRLLIISDMYFLVFDTEIWNKNSITLLFWTTIRALVTIKKLIKNDLCRFFWKQKNKLVKCFNLEKL
jgi:hypothetical protein